MIIFVGTQFPNTMSILSNNQKGGKKNAKGAVKKSAVPGAPSAIKQNKAASFSKKPVKTGGTRGS
jgi:hypothetical protein